MDKRIYGCILSKGLYSLIISEHYDEIFAFIDCLYEFDKCLLENVSYVIDFALPFMDDNIEDNSRKIINYYRFKEYNSKEEKEEVFKLLNDLTQKINSRNTDEKSVNLNRLDYIYTEYKEKNLKLTSSIKKDIQGNLDDYFKLAKEFCFADFRVLVFNTSVICQEDYFEYLPDFYESNPFFVNNVMSLLNQFPDLLGDETFKLRIQLDISVIQNHLNSDNKISSKIKKSKEKQILKCLNMFDKRK